MARKKHRILMVSDFFYPNFGGVENHIYSLSQGLLRLGHKVVVVTHAYGSRVGVRWLTDGLKVYYIPNAPFFLQNTFPTIWTTLPLFRCIMLRESITIVHGHQAFSTLCHEGILHARTMGLPAVFTDHSLYGFSDIGSIHMNKVLKFSLSNVHRVICVSHTSRENTVLRSGLPPHRVSVIPNAMDPLIFQPCPTRNDGTTSTDYSDPVRITVVVASRLVYRKGADLLAELIPRACGRFPQVDFLIGGDGPKRSILEKVRVDHHLEDRVKLLGAVPHSEVRSVLIQGQIFLNCSLTEAFCIALIEAASCGLLCVSTRVGGVPEVLPEEMLILAEPSSESLLEAIGAAIQRLPAVNPWEMHQKVAEMYSWHDVAERTEKVYDLVADVAPDDLLDRLERYYGCGPWAGKIFCFVVILNHLLLLFLQWWQPRESIDVAPDFPTAQFLQEKKCEIN